MISIDKIQALVDEELCEANKLHGPFMDNNHAYGVLAEEVSEANREMRAVDWHLNQFLIMTIKKESIMQLAREMKTTALKGIQELIQVVAMCDKAIICEEARNCRYPEHRIYVSEDIDNFKENICENFCYHKEFGFNEDGECQYITDHDGKCPLDSL